MTKFLVRISKFYLHIWHWTAHSINNLWIFCCCWFRDTEITIRALLLWSVNDPPTVFLAKIAIKYLVIQYNWKITSPRKMLRKKLNFVESNDDELQLQHSTVNIQMKYYLLLTWKVVLELHDSIGYHFHVFKLQDIHRNCAYVCIPITVLLHLKIIAIDKIII